MRLKIGKRRADDAGLEVTEERGMRVLHLGSRAIQSAMRITRPWDLELAYTRAMMGFLMFNPMPQDVLMIGLGGGSLAKFIRKQRPQTLHHGGGNRPAGDCRRARAFRAAARR